MHVAPWFAAKHAGRYAGEVAGSLSAWRPGVQLSEDCINKQPAHTLLSYAPRLASGELFDLAVGLGRSARSAFNKGVEYVGACSRRTHVSAQRHHHQQL